MSALRRLRVENFKFTRSRKDICCLSTFPGWMWISPVDKRRYSTNLQQDKEIREQTLGDDDTEYFHRLGKTTNNYWMSNASEILPRLNIHSLIHPGAEETSLKENWRRRACDINLQRIRQLHHALQQLQIEHGGDGGNAQKRRNLQEELIQQVLWVPNSSSKESLAIHDEIPKVIGEFGEKPEKFQGLEFQKYCDKHGWLKNDSLGNLAYHRSYYLKGFLAELESALVKFGLDSLKKNGFELISVPDILFPHVIESCGMRTRGQRDQVFWLEDPTNSENELCLSGTAEMALAGLFQNRVFELSELPVKVGAVSRCFRAETSSLEEEKGLFRVHEFTKVELFGITSDENGKESQELHQELREMQEDNFNKLGIHFKTLEMPPSELGLPAQRKFDIEAWMPGRGIYGEISSCSNCTDFQSRRLNIRYRNGAGELSFCHTLNGTAIAIPRLLITLVENFQSEDGSVELPKVLKPHMRPKEREQETYKTTYLRTKSSQMRTTKDFRKLELKE